MKSGTITIIEGTSNTGKTTLCQSFVKAGYVCIEEAIRYLEKRTGLSQEFIMRIPKTIEQERLNSELLFDVEFEKLFDASLMAQTGKNVIIDKSAVSIVSTAFAFEKEMGLVGAYEYSLSLLNNLVDKAYRFHLLMPSRCIVLNTNETEFQKRNLKRDHILSGVWQDQRIIAYQNQILERYNELVQIPTTILNTSNLSIEEVFGEACSILAIEKTEERNGQQKE